LFAITALSLSCGRASIRNLETGLRSCQEELYQVQTLLHRQEGRIVAAEKKVQQMAALAPQAHKDPEALAVSEEALRAACGAGDWGRVVHLTAGALTPFKVWPREAVLFYGARGLEETGRLQEASEYYRLLEALWPQSPYGAEALWRRAALCRTQGALDCERLVLHNLVSSYPGSRWEKEASRRLVALRKANRR